MAKGRRSKSTGAKKEDVIECILEHDGTPDDLAGLEFKVHWLGSSADEDEWHYYEALKDMPVLQSYIAQHPDLSALGKKKRAKTEWTMVGDALSQTEVDEYLQGHVRKPQDTRYKVYICTIHHQCKHSFRVRNAEEEDQYILEEAHAHSTELVAVVSGEEDAPATAEDTDSKAKKSKKEKVKKEKVIKEEGDVAEDSDETVKELAHSCPKCGKGFKSKLGIKYHRENVCVERPEAKENEEGEALSSEPVVRSPAFKCSMCNKSFVSGLGYKYHIRHVCVQEPIFPCTKCGKECSSEAKLSKHVASCTATELVKKWAKRKSSGPDMVSLAAKHEMKSDEDGEPTVLSIAPQEESVVIEGNTGL